VSVIKCVCGDEKDVHTLKERRGRWYRGACTNTKCGCTAFLEVAEVVEPVDSRVFTAARERIAQALARGDFGRQDDMGHWYRVADGVLALFPPERVAELFPDEAAGS
jgi:hypothetical protein